MYVFPILAGHETCPLSRFGVSGVAELPFPFPCETKLSWAILGISQVAGDKGSSVLLASLYVVVLLPLVPSPRNGGKIPDEVNALSLSSAVKAQSATETPFSQGWKAKFCA